MLVTLAYTTPDSGLTYTYPIVDMSAASADVCSLL